MIQSAGPSKSSVSQTGRPGNLVRNAYHVLNAVVVLLLVQYILTTDTLRVLVAGLTTATAWSMEISRRLSPAINRLLMGLFAPVAHPDEAEHINSATWYATAVFTLAVVAPLPAGMVGLAVLGLGDPAAAIVGKRWGSLRIADGRSLEGSAAFVVAGALAAGLTLWLWHPEIPHRGLLSLVAGVAGAIAELVPARALSRFGVRRLDDNLLIPLAAAAAVATLQWTMGA